MKEFLKPIYYYYMRAMFYMGIAKGEITKPLQFWNETLLILIYLKTIGIVPNISWTLGIYVLIFLCFVIIGKILTILGVVKYNKKLDNHQNNELMLILKKIEDIEKKL